MPYDPQKHHRRSIRLKSYNYSQPGAYFVTIDAHNRECLFGEVLGGQMRLSAFGRIVQRAWLDLPHHYPYVFLDAFCIMPNHVHMIIILEDTECRGGSSGQTNAMSRQESIAWKDTEQEGETRPYGTGIGDGKGGSSVPDKATAHPEDFAWKDTDSDGETRPYRHGLQEMIRAFKTFSARRINERRHIRGIPVWQRNYYERVIWDEEELDAFRKYIQENPAKWELDQENPSARQGSARPKQ